jgi:SAM-dependent methyltransferase
MSSFSHVLRRTHATLANAGLNPLHTLSALRHLPAFIKDARTYRAHQQNSMPLRLSNLFPILTDKTATAGAHTSHYFQMDLFMARRVHAAKPKQHLDIGSRLDGFLGHLIAAGQPVTMVDIRPLPNPPQGLDFKQDDATTLKSIKSNSVPSLSSLHAAEHFGLGRYGDPIDPAAAEKFMTTLARVLKPGGHLYFATPIGVERLEFNAHRVFSPATIQRIFVEQAGLTLEESAVITTAGSLIPKANPLDYSHEHFACGLYLFTKE